MGVDVAYDHFEKAPSLPFIVYVDEGKESFIADSKIYTKKRNIRIELYTETKDLATEEKLENFLEENFKIFTDDETIYIKDQELYKHNYYISI